jgi:hemerythrin-like domain-containing protein
MDTYLNRAIIDVITEFPEVGTVLAEYDVGCVTCQVGTCLLKDVVAIHGLPPETERELMARVAAVISPGAATQTPRPHEPSSIYPLPAGKTAATAVTGAPRNSPGGAAATAPKYSPPMKRLVDEHVVIKRWVALIPEIVRSADVDSADDRQLLLDGVDFVRSFADKYHHAKEEDILFKYFDETQEIIRAMLADHETARAHTRGVAEAVEARDGASAAEHLTAYGELLHAHIRKEDEILFPWMDRELTTAQVGELFARFAEVDGAAGEGFVDRYTELVARIERSVASRTSLLAEAR